MTRSEVDSAMKSAGRGDGLGVKGAGRRRGEWGLPLGWQCLTAVRDAGQFVVGACSGWEVHGASGEESGFTSFTTHYQACWPLPSARRCCLLTLGGEGHVPASPGTTPCTAYQLQAAALAWSSGQG